MNKNKEFKLRMSALLPIFLMATHFDPTHLLICEIMGGVIIALLIAILIVTIINKKLEPTRVQEKIVERIVVKEIEKEPVLVEEEKEEEQEPEPAPAPVPVVQDVDESQAKTLSQSLASAKESGATGLVTKMDVLNHLKEKFGDYVECKHRPNYANPGRGMTVGLPQADTHYTANVAHPLCFTYVYELANETVLLLLRLDYTAFSVIKEEHNIAFSAFPRVSTGNKWFSVVVDSSFNKEMVYAMVDAAYFANGGFYEGQVEDSLALKESLAIAKTVSATGLVSKQSIIDFIRSKYTEAQVECKHRPNYANPGRGMTIGLPQADTHYAQGPEKKICFTYVYEDDEGKILLLIKTSAEHVKEIKTEHKNIHKSRFPRSVEDNWYSAPIDGSYTAEQVYAILDRMIADIMGVKVEEKPVEEPVVEEPKEEEVSVSLKEGLAKSKEVSAVGVVNKEYICKYLSEHYTEEQIEQKHRPNYAPPGRGMTVGLIQADTHYVIGEKKVCFIYIYETDEGKVMFLIKASKEYIKELKKDHKYIVKSKFPRCVDDNWYNVIVDNSFTTEQIERMIDALIEMNHGSPVEKKPEEEHAEEAPVVEEPVAEEVKEEPKEEEAPVVEEVKEEPKVEEAKPEEPKEEPAPVVEEPVVEEPEIVIEAIQADKMMTDAELKDHIKENIVEVESLDDEVINPTIVFVSTLNDFFKSGEIVNLETVKERIPNFSKAATYLKVLPRGKISKRLKVYADEYSKVAQKMIVLAGGEVYVNKKQKVEK